MFYSSTKKYLISGIGPGPSGVGRLMNVLVPEYRSKGYCVIVRRAPKSVHQLIKNKNFFSVTFEFALRFIDKLVFPLRCLCIFNSEIVFLQPQKAGYLIFFFLVYFNKAKLYVMDNSFFCICSYNTHPIDRNECLECVGNAQPHRLCFPSPARIPKLLNILYIKHLHAISSRLIFLSQNALQRDLLFLHFGNNIRVCLEGMNPLSSHELTQSLEIFAENMSKTPQFDIVFHGSSIAAKGIFYILELAELMPEYTFLIPDKVSTVLRVTSVYPPSNVSCIEMSWETGLREAIASARLVINPSMWSAPIEGALLKSAMFNNNVATVFSRYGYEGETTSINNHLRLPQDSFLASNILREYFESSN